MCDSKAAISDISSNVKDSLFVLECDFTLNKLAALNEVLLLWVPDHSKRDGNIFADFFVIGLALEYPFSVLNLCLVFQRNIAGGR